MLIVISGPTAVGKTSLAVKLCKKINGAIISADSRQVYKYLDIGTNKDGTLKDGIRFTDGIAQYLTDIINPDQKYDVKSFEQQAEKYINQISYEGKIPVVTGGTGLYIKALLYGLDDLPFADSELREEIEDIIKQNGLDYIYNKLLEVDKISAIKNKGNTQRIVRAYEVYKLTGKPMSELINIKPKKNIKFVHFVILDDREKIYENINGRCKKMLDSGMIEETQKVLAAGYDKNCYGLTGIGYRHIVSYLDNKISKETLYSSFAQDTRQYAKRQITWFKNQSDKEIVYISSSEIDKIIEDIIKKASKND